MYMRKKAGQGGWWCNGAPTFNMSLTIWVTTKIN